MILVKRLEAKRPGQISEVYRRGDEYVWVSTVPDVDGPDLSPEMRAFVMLGNFAGDMLDRPHASSGEETMAFRCDEDGNVEDWEEIAVAVGPGSRVAVLSELGAAAP